MRVLFKQPIGEETASRLTNETFEKRSLRVFVTDDVLNDYWRLARLGKKRGLREGKGCIEVGLGEESRRRDSYGRHPWAWVRAVKYVDVIGECFFLFQSAQIQACE